MSRNAVTLLLFFITGLLLAEPFTTLGLTPVSSAVTNGSEDSGNMIISGDSLMAQNYPILAKKTKLAAFGGQMKVIKAVITGFSSTAEETDNTPFITASGSYVRYGVAAANFLPIGTRIRIPKVFGDQVFVVEDRMNARFNDRIDIWFPGKKDAMDFGLKITDVEIL